MVTTVVAMPSALDALNTCAAHAEKYCDTDSHVVPTMSPGDTWWQGDCGVQFIGVSCRWKPQRNDDFEVQLAEGEGKGSKHVAVVKGGTCEKLGGTLFGWILYCPKGLSVLHPVHGDVTFEEPGFYLVRFQRGFAPAARGSVSERVVFRTRD